MIFIKNYYPCILFVICLLFISQHSYTQVKDFQQGLTVYTENGKSIKASNWSNQSIKYTFIYEFTFYDREAKLCKIEQVMLGCIPPNKKELQVTIIPKINESDANEIVKIEIIDVTIMPDDMCW